MASSFLRFLNHTQRRSTVGRTPLDEWSARRRDLYLTTHNTHNRLTSMLPVGFEPTISAGERPQTYALDRHIYKYICVCVYIYCTMHGSKNVKFKEKILSTFVCEKRPWEYEVLTTMNMMIIVFWDVTPMTCCFHVQSIMTYRNIQSSPRHILQLRWRWRQPVSPNSW
jgi:hypothetical protein